MLAKAGVLVSTAGIALLVSFVAVLMTFPVTKECDVLKKCSYTSTAPEKLAALVHPEFFAVSLIVISTGLLMLRFSRWKSDKKTKGRL